MSGHNKWSTIKNKKGINDAQKSAMFTKASRAIMIAVKNKETNPELNYALQAAIQRAKEIGMPKEKIENAIKSSINDISNITKIFYNATGLKGSCFIIECNTDNTTRAVSNVRAVLSRNNGKLVDDITHKFKKVSYFVFNKAEIPNYDEFISDMLCSDFYTCDETQDDMTFFYEVNDFGNIKDNMTKKNIAVKEAGICYIPLQEYIVSLEQEDLNKMSEMISALESLDDVYRVYTNIS